MRRRSQVRDAVAKCTNTLGRSTCSEQEVTRWVVFLTHANMRY